MQRSSPWSLCYVTDTGVMVRLVRFEDVTSGKRAAEDIAALIVGFLEEHECLDKVVAQCYDGAAVMSPGLNGVQAKRTTQLLDDICQRGVFLVWLRHRGNAHRDWPVQCLRREMP
ncbi:unnamed protein product [Arctogadus glacialis]